MNVMLQEGAIMPTKGTINSAGYDLYSLEDAIIGPFSRRKLHTGVHLDMPNSLAGIIAHRSGMNANDGVVIYGTVDPDYTGELKVNIINTDARQEVRIRKGDRIAQLVLVPFFSPVLMQVDHIEKVTQRGEGGHGSTGR